MKRINTIAVIFLVLAASTHAQKVMTPPHMMVVPDLTYCGSGNRNFTQQVNNNGITETIPDYEKAISEDPTLHAVLTQIAQLITDNNPDIVNVDIIEAINNAKADAAMAAANGGDEAESIDEAIIRNSGADILVKVFFDIIKNGPEYRIQYVLNGTDAYTSRNFAPVQGIGKGSTSANPIVMLQEAVYENMAPFTEKLMSYYFSMLKKGRMVAFDIKTSSTASVNMSSRIDGHSLREWIGKFLYDNSVDGGGVERVKGGNTFLQYQGVYIPLTCTDSFGDERRQSAGDVAQRLVDFLEGKGVSAEYKTRGLGKVNIYIY